MTGHEAAKGQAGASHGHPAGHAHHRNYVKIWAILVGLLVISVVGPMTGIRVVMLTTAFGIALVKAYMVAKNFMHLDVEKPIVHWLLAVGLALMVLLYGALAPDVQKGEGQYWKKDAGFHHSFTPETGHGAPAHGRGTRAEHGSTGADSDSTGHGHP